MKSSPFIGIALVMASVAIASADILPPGHKNVQHELVFENSDLFGQYRLIAAPIAGFHGVEIVRPGIPFSFSSKYGTRFYLLPSEREIPSDFDRESFAQWPSCDPPVSEIRSVPRISPMASAVTTLRWAGVSEAGPMIELANHVELDRSGNPVRIGRMWLILAGVLTTGLVLCWIAYRALRKLRTASPESVGASKRS